MVSAIWYTAHYTHNYMLLLTWLLKSCQQVELPSLWTSSISKQQQQKRKVGPESTTKTRYRSVDENTIHERNSLKNLTNRLKSIFSMESMKLINIFTQNIGIKGRKVIGSNMNNTCTRLISFMLNINQLCSLSSH